MQNKTKLLWRELEDGGISETFPSEDRLARWSYQNNSAPTFTP